MSGQLTQFGANRGVVAGVGKAVTAASRMYLALATALPASPNTATLTQFDDTELTTAGYERQAVTWGDPSGEPSEVANDSEVVFGPFEADPPEVSTIFLTDTSIGSSGNVMAYWSVDVNRDAGNADSLRIAIGDLTLSVGACPA